MDLPSPFLSKGEKTIIGNSIVTPIQALWSRFRVSIIEKRTDPEPICCADEGLAQTRS